MLKQTEEATLPRLLTRRDVADLLGINPRTIRRLELAGKLPRARLGHRTVRYRRAAVEDLLSRLEREGGAA